MKLLLHLCCGPCATVSYIKYQEMGYDPVGYFYNPNIHPYREFKKRWETLEDYGDREGIPLVMDRRYRLEEFLQEVMVARGGESRCLTCYRLRLKEAARLARQEGIGFFSTSLSLSPYQDHGLLRQAGEEAAAVTGVSFLYEDLRPLFRESQRVSREMGLYRQPYCGCIFSEKERYYRDS